MLNLNKKELKAVQKLKKSISEKFELLDFQIYGSKARGDNENDSDIDIMVILNQTSYDNEKIIDEIVFQVNIEFDVFLSVVYFSKNELENGPMDESPLFRAIKRDGIPV